VQACRITTKDHNDGKGYDMGVDLPVVIGGAGAGDNDGSDSPDAGDQYTPSIKDVRNEIKNTCYKDWVLEDYAEWEAREGILLMDTLLQFSFVITQ